MKIKITLLLSFFLFCWYHLKAQVPDSTVQLLQGKLPSQNITSTNFDLDISDSKTIITSEEIFARGYDNLDELLASVPGVFISHDRTFTQVGIRTPSATAENNQRIQILLDDVPLNNPFSGQAPSGYDLRGINMEDIEEVIIIRNASPIENGNNAMLGVIKINTKLPKKGLRLNLDTGSYGELDGGFAVGQTIGKANIGFSGRLAGINGQELFFPEDEILTKESSDFGGTRIRFNLGNFSLNASYYQRKEAVPSVPNNPFALTIDSMFFIDSTQFIFKEALDVEGNFEEDAFILDAHFSAALSPRQSIDLGVFFNYNNDSRQQIFRDTEIFIDSIGQDTIGYIEYFERPKQQNLWAGLNYRHNFRILPSNELSFGTSVVLLPISRFESDNELLVHFDGIDTLTTDFEEDILDYVDFKEENFNNDFSYWSVGLFVEDKLKVSQWLTLNFGARVEINAQTQPIFAPQMAIRFTPFQQKTHFRFSYSRGYRLPTIRETDVVITDNLIAAPNPNPDENLMPETSDNFELGISQKIGKDLDLNLGLYHQALNDLIWNETTMINRQNDSTIAVTGLEGEIRISLPKGIRSYFNYNFQFDQKDKINWPSPLCKFGVTLPFFRHFSFFFEGQYEGERLNFDKTFTSSYFLLNTNLLVRPKVEESHWLNNFAFSVRAYNVLNEYYIHPSGSAFIPNAIPQNGRTWQTQLTYEF